MELIAALYVSDLRSSERDPMRPIAFHFIGIRSTLTNINERDKRFLIDHTRANNTDFYLTIFKVRIIK